jgi:hypothetical protein
MIDKTLRDFNLQDIDKLIKVQPERYANLCKIIGEHEFDIRHLTLGIAMTYQEDVGCVIAMEIKNDTAHVISCKYF